MVKHVEDNPVAAPGPNSDPAGPAAPAPPAAPAKPNVGKLGRRWNAFANAEIPLVPAAVPDVYAQRSLDSLFGDPIPSNVRKFVATIPEPTLRAKALVNPDGSVGYRLKSVDLYGRGSGLVATVGGLVPGGTARESIPPAKLVEAAHKALASALAGSALSGCDLGPSEPRPASEFFVQIAERRGAPVALTVL